MSIHEFLRSIIALVFWVVVARISSSAESTDPSIDVQHYCFQLEFTDEDDTVRGTADITLNFLRTVKSFKLDLIQPHDGGNGMIVSGVTEKEVSLAFKQVDDALWIISPAERGSRHVYNITYQGVPSDGLIFSRNRSGRRTIFADNWPDRAHNWLPCVDSPDDKAQLDFYVTAPGHYQVVGNGLKLDESDIPGGKRLTHWQETSRLPTKVMAIGLAEFAVDRPGDVQGIPVYTYVFPEDWEAGFRGYAFATEILAFYIEKIGPFPYKKLANVQSKTKFGGMENAGAIFYAEQSVNSPSIEELMAHEIAHQWFGDSATEKSFAHLWLSEGFATYLASVYLEHKYGDAVLKSRMRKDREAVFRFEARRMTPLVDASAVGSITELLNTNCYQKGEWILHMLRRELGEQAFWQGVRNYYAKYRDGNADTDDFRVLMEQASGKNLRQFFTQWTLTPGHPRLNVAWRYDSAKKVVSMKVVQMQSAVFAIPLELEMDSVPHTVQLKERVTELEIESMTSPAKIVFDPNVGLLATFEVVKTD